MSSKCDKLLKQARNAPNSLRFDEICYLAECYGFVFVRQKGSHKIYKLSNYKDSMVFHDRNGMAAEYQVKDLLNAIDESNALGN